MRTSLPLLFVAWASTSCGETHELAKPQAGEARGASQDDTGTASADSEASVANDAGPTTATADSGAPARAAIEAPPHWRRVAGNCGISMQASTLIAEPSRGTDSCIASFEGIDCTYVGDLGGFSNTLQEFVGDPRYDVESVKVDGKVARLVSAREPDGEQGYFLGIHFPPPLWSGASSTLSFTMTARCLSAQGAKNGRLVLQTVALPKGELTTPPLVETTPCEGEDIRSILGYRLGRSCVEGKVAVPGVCALAAKAHAVTGTGSMRCFVSSAGDYYWAHVAYGEKIAGAGSRYGSGKPPAQPSQLEAAEEGRCALLVQELGASTAHASITGEPSYSACP